MILDHFGMYPERAFIKVAGRMTLEGGGKGGSAPPPPDYVGAANATAAGNKEAAMAAQAGNMINQYTPYGSVEYTQRGTSNGTPLWAQNVRLSPEQQAAYNRDVAMNAQLQGVASQGVGYVQNALNAPLQSPGQAVGSAGATNFVSNVNAPNLNVGGANLGGLTRSIGEPSIGLTTGAQAGPMQMGIGNNAGQIATSTGAGERAGGFGYNPAVQTGIGYAGNINQGVMNNAGQIGTNLQDPALVQQQVTDALYQQQTAMLDPQFRQSQAALENQLANQGITRGSEAFNEEMRKANLNKQMAYESARQSAIGQGVNAAQGMFGMNLQGMQARNAALGQQFGQGITAQQAQNAAQAQQFAQNQAAQQAYNQAIGQQFSQGQSNQQLANQAAAQNNALAQTNAAFQNQALGQQFGQGMQAATFANQAQQQAYQQQLSNAQMQNQARAQQLQEALSRGEFTNQAQAQAYAQELQNIQQQNAALTQQFGFGLTNAELANQAANQQFAQRLSNAQLANQALQQNFANAQTLRQEPINILNAVRTGSQMQSAAMPQVGVSAPGQLATWSGPDLLGATTAQGQYNQGLYNQQQAASNAQTQGMYGLGSAAIMGGAML